MAARLASEKGSRHPQEPLRCHRCGVFSAQLTSGKDGVRGRNTLWEKRMAKDRPGEATEVFEQKRNHGGKSSWRT